MSAAISNISVIPNSCKGEESFYHRKISPGVYLELAEGDEDIGCELFRSIYNSYSVYSLFFVLFFIAPIIVGGSGISAQSQKADSILSLLKMDKPDTNKVSHLFQLTQECELRGNFEKGLSYGSEGLELASKLNSRKAITKFSNTIGTIYMEQGNYPKALDYYIKALKLDEELKNKKGIATRIGNIGNVYMYQGDYTKALDYYFKALKMDEELGDKSGLARHLGTVGIVFNEQHNFLKALDYYFKALKMDEDLLEEAKQTGNSEEIGRNKNLITTWLGNIGSVYFDQKQYPEALKYYSNALKSAEELGDKDGIARNLGCIGTLYAKTEKFKEAEDYLKRALAIYESIGGLDYLSQFEESLSQLYQTTGSYELALIHYKRAIGLKDTLFSQENKKELVRKEMNYEFEKKEAAIKAEQDKKDAVAETENRRQLLFLWFVIAGALAVGVIAMIVFRSYRITKKQNEIIENQKQKVEIQNIEITKQKHLVEEKNRDIFDSVSYAQRIQSSFLTSEVYIKRYLPEYFILYKPKDVVSGDFYWMHQQGEYFYFCVADCTGHGIPGAFMSLIGMGILNEIIYSKPMKETNTILDELRRIVILALNPEGKIEEGNDGMDLVLGRLHLKTKELQYSAAHNPFYIYRKGELIKHSADKMPVGRYSDFEKPFTQHNIHLKTGDIIYVSTDGYRDQFGGTEGKKFMSKKFEKYISLIANEPLQEQKKMLENEFAEWRGTMEQVDDVCVFGVKI